jgi:UDP-N-acetylmuramoyl-tripeptide--D-alanyl-D-alanine ligase
MTNPDQALKPLEAWTLGEVAAAAGGALDARWTDRPFGAISTDSRTLEPGQYFLALRGEKFDGHRFCEGAARLGAAGLIVDRQYEIPESLADVPILQVADTLAAYGDLAAERRRQWGRPVLAISGSAGKTTTRRLVAEALGRHLRVLEPVKNYNNLIGVPYTLLGLAAEHEAAVIELGMNLPGELARLTRIANPTAAALTQIGLTHVGMFACEADLVSAKLDLFRNCAPGTPLAINAACPRTAPHAGEFAASHPIVWFRGERDHGTVNRAPLAVAVENVIPIEPVGYRFDLALPGGTLKGLELHLFGRHHLANVAAAAALLHAAGFPAEWVAGALDGFRTEPLRGEIVRAGEVNFILDCYNASPPSMLGALGSLNELPCSGRRILVLADMLELGDHAAREHDGLKGPIRALAPALFFGLGPEMKRVATALAAEGQPGAGFEKREELVAALKAALKPGDQVFFKGSHGFSLEKVAQALAPEAEILA